MARVLILLSIIVVLLIKNSGTASIEIPMNTANVSNLTQPYSLMNITENEYSGAITILETKQTIGNYSNNGVIVTEISDLDFNLNISDFIMPSPTPNITCFRRDYEDDVAAIFRGNVGPLDTAYIVFNTTYNSIHSGLIFNTTGVIGLRMVNETTVDCGEYSLVLTRRLNFRTMSSLLGGAK